VTDSIRIRSPETIDLVHVGELGLPLIAAASGIEKRVRTWLVEWDGEVNELEKYPVDDEIRAVALGCLSGTDRPFLVVVGRRIHAFRLFSDGP
jgi:hypothetical protein